MKNELIILDIEYSSCDRIELNRCVKFGRPEEGSFLIMDIYLNDIQDEPVFISFNPEEAALLKQAIEKLGF